MFLLCESCFQVLDEILPRREGVFPDKDLRSVVDGKTQLRQANMEFVIAVRKRKENQSILIEKPSRQLRYFSALPKRD